MEETKRVVLNNWQKDIWFDPHRFTVLDIGRRGGKALALDTPILTPNGYKQMGDIQVGDYCISPRGNKTKVLYVSPIFNDHPCYEITFSNGEKIVADEEHLWVIEDKKLRKNNVRNLHKKLNPRIMKTGEMAGTYKVKRNDRKIEHRYAVHKSEPILFDKKNLLFPPYALGCWLGDGNSDDSAITVTENEIRNTLLKNNIRIEKKGKKETITYTMYKADKYDAALKRQEHGTTYKNILKKLNVLNNKHIPKEYLFSDIDDRKQLLMGLMDTDGTIGIGGKCEFSVTNKVLAENTLFLIRSLGIKANIRESDAKLYGRIISKRYRIIFKPNFNCFLLSYKRTRYHGKNKSDTTRYFITNIKRVDSVKTKCIMVDDDTHMYLAGKSLIPTHNTTYSALKMADFVSKHSNSIVYYVAPTYIQAKNIMWEMLKQYIPAHWIVEKKEQELKLVLQNGSRIELKGADSEPDRLRGVRIDFLICDEIAFFRNWKIVWEKVLRPTLMDSRGKALFISTPNGYNHFYDLYMKGFEGKQFDKDYISYKFTSYDNNYLPKEEIEKARVESDGDTFAQEYLAEFKKYTGMVLKMFSREHHFIAPIEIQNSWSFYRGIDFGWAHPSACIFITVDPGGKVYVYDEIKQSGLTNPEFANLIKQKSIGRSFTQSWGDSAAASDIRELNNYGLSVIPISKSSGSNEDFTKFKVRKLNEKLKANKLFIFNNCGQTLQEAENWQYKEVRDGSQVREVPAKINDDLMDALSYCIIPLPEYFESSYARPENSIYSAPDWAGRLPKWSGAQKRDGYNSYFEKNR